MKTERESSKRTDFSVERSSAEVGQIAPQVREVAANYYSPEQLLHMADRRQVLKQQWGMRRVGEAATTFVSQKREIASFPPVRTVQPEPVARKEVQVLPINTQVATCPTCKMAVRDDACGYVRDPLKIGRAQPCPTCSPRVKMIKAARKLEHGLGDLFGGANIPDYARAWNFSTYPVEGDLVAKEESQAFANKQTAQRGLYLWGELGRGKTSLAISVLKTFLARRESGLYIRAVHYVRLANQTFSGSEKNASILDLAYTVTCLVLDDLAVEQATEATIRQWYELIEERRGTDGLYTVITSNRSIDELEERWRPEGVTPGMFQEGMRVTDRLRESWGELVIQGMNMRASNHS